MGLCNLETPHPKVSIFFIGLSCRWFMIYALIMV
jgi:hypothetical protein